MTDDIPRKRGPGRPKGSKNKPRGGQAVDYGAENSGYGNALGHDSTALIQAMRTRLFAPTTLADAFDMDRRVVVKALSECPVAKYERGNSPRYRLKDACQFLFKDYIGGANLTEALKNVNPDDLPANLQGETWNARLRAQKWKFNAGELWPTSRVVEALTNVFTTIRSSLNLWADDVAEDQSLPDETRAELTRRVDDLRSAIYHELVEMPEQARTGNQSSEYDEPVVIGGNRSDPSKDSGDSGG